MTELYLAWNKIWAPGGIEIGEILLLDTRLKVLDLSWNVMGQYPLGCESKEGDLG